MGQGADFAASPVWCLGDAGAGRDSRLVTEAFPGRRDGAERASPIAGEGIGELA